MRTLEIKEYMDEVKSNRLWKVRTEYETIFYAKGGYCPKRQGTKNYVWLANEIVYWKFASLAGLRMPNVALLRDKNNFLFWGSEFCDGRVKLESENALQASIDRIPENKTQLTRALLLDIALLNSDRVLSAILKDRNDFLWFIDHDKSLWGDGMEKENETCKSGDLDRVNVKNLADSEKIDDFLGDYAPRGAKTINRIVWAQEWTTILEEFRKLPLDEATFHAACSEVPEGWLPDSLPARMLCFLKEWWSELEELFVQDCFQQRMQDILTKRCKY